jgi:hypothetical protein
MSRYEYKPNPNLPSAKTSKTLQEQLYQEQVKQLSMSVEEYEAAKEQRIEYERVVTFRIELLWIYARSWPAKYRDPIAACLAEGDLDRTSFIPSLSEDS